MNLVFIVGTGRCGSTLVHEILAKHEAFGFISNIEDNFPFMSAMGRWTNALYRTPLGNFTRKGGLRFAPSEAYRLISREVSPIYANSCRDLYADDVTPWLEKRFRQFFESRAHAQNKPVFSHKYTGWPRISFFTKIFPEAKFIHIVRDGRAVANSWLQMPWWGGYRGPENWLWGALKGDYREEWEQNGRSFPQLAAIAWKILMDAFHDAEVDLASNNYLKLKYEDILEDPEERFRQILAFCGVDWSDRFELSFRRQHFKKNRSRAFDDDLTLDQVREMEKSLGALLAQYGYDTDDTGQQKDAPSGAGVVVSASK